MALGEGTADTKAKEGNVPGVFLAQHRVQCGCNMQGLGEMMVENGVREITGSQNGQCPCKDGEWWYLERWQPMTKVVMCSDLGFKKFVLLCRRLKEATVEAGKSLPRLL